MPKVLVTQPSVTGPDDPRLEALHAAGWGLFLVFAHGNPAMAGLGTLAYTFGLRHAFDADHIAAIDNTTRKLLQDGQRPMGVGFFFSLGHSTIVFSLAAGLAIAAATVDSQVPAFQDYGGTVGATVSGTFLWVIGIIILPYLGVFIYLIARGHKMQEHAIDAAKAQDAAAKAYIQSAVGSGKSPAEELATLADLKEKGVIDDAEFQSMKAKIVT